MGWLVGGRWCCMGKLELEQKKRTNEQKRLSFDFFKCIDFMFCIAFVVAVFVFLAWRNMVGFIILYGCDSTKCLLALGFLKLGWMDGWLIGFVWFENAVIALSYLHVNSSKLLLSLVLTTKYCLLLRLNKNVPPPSPPSPLVCSSSCSCSRSCSNCWSSCCWFSCCCCWWWCWCCCCPVALSLSVAETVVWISTSCANKIL